MLTPEQNVIKEKYYLITKSRQRKNAALYATKYAAENPKKIACHQAVAKALRQGKLHKLNACEQCGDTISKLVGHHADYSKPLEVEWLCRKCHAIVH